MGAKKGEVVTIYMPQIPELVIAMLACAKIGQCIAWYMVVTALKHLQNVLKMLKAGS